MWVWIGVTLVSQTIAVAQSQVRGNDIGRIKSQADLYFREAAYDKAVRLYKLCTAYLNPNAGDKAALQSQIQKAQRLTQLDGLLLAEVRNKNYAKATAYSEEMLRLNPNDPYVKVTRNDLKSSANQRFNTQDARLLSRADVLIGQGNWSAAQAILRLVDQLPNGRKNSEVAAKLNMVNELAGAERAISLAIRNGDPIRAEQIVGRLREKYPTEVERSRVIATLPKLDEQYIADRKQLFQAVARQIARCDYDRATQLLIEAKLKPGFATDPQLLARINSIRSVERQLQNITNWKTDPNKRTITVQAYKSVYAKKDFRGCIQEGYYDYLTAEAQMKQNGSNYAGAIIAYKTATAISPALARRDQINEKISICDSLSKCPDKDRTFVALMRTADQLYQQCNCDSAVVVWQSAKPYLSSVCSTGIRNQATWSDWSGNVTECQNQKSEISRYTSLVSQAETLLENKNCQQSEQLLTSASDIKVRCSSLSKKRVDSLLIVCSICIKQQCYDSLVTAAERSRRLGFDIDALKSYRQAKACVEKKNEQVLTRAIDELTCKVEGKGCPLNTAVDLDNLKPDLKTILFDISLGGGVMSAKSPDGSVQLPLRYTGYLKLGIGIKFMPKRSFISGGLGIHLNRYQFNAANTSILAGSNASIFNAGVYSFLDLHSPNFRSGKWYPYLSGGYALSMPLLLNLKNNQNSVISTDKKFLTSSLPSLNYGIGIEKINRNTIYKIGLSYQNTAGDFFRNQPIDSRNISLIGLNIFIINLGISFR